MADTYEKDLAQKSSLTVNDFIRVVGTDNVSYKQLVSDVAKKIIENYIGSSLAGSSQSVKSALDSLNSNSLFWQFSGLTFAQLDSQITSAKINTPFIGFVQDSSSDRPASGVNSYIVMGWLNSTKLYGWRFAVGFGESIYISVRRNTSTWSAWKSVALS